MATGEQTTGERASAATQDQDAVRWRTLADGVEINEAAWSERARRILGPDAVRLVARLHRALEGRRQELLAARRVRQKAWDGGEVPGYLPPDEHPEARGGWRVAELPEDLLTRRVEITGPVSDPKMVINMLSRNDRGERADAAMLDFEDSLKPTWENVMRGMENLVGAVDGSLTYEKPGADKVYEIDPDDMPLLMVRIRGLHLDESNLRVDGAPVSGALLDLALAAHHTARELMERGRTPKYYVPKVEHYLEARWFDRLFVETQEALGIPRGTFRATFLIETLPAAFQMEEILYEFREHAAGLNGGRWDKIFSDIKVLKEHPDRVLADRNWIDIERPWMEMYVKQLIRVCHRHGAFGMGGMAPQTPGRTEEQRRRQVAGVVADKEFEAGIGHDGCWVSHPYFIGPAMEPFDEVLEAKGATHQLDVLPDIPDRPDLLPRAEGPKTLDGIRVNVRVSIGYIKGWLDGRGAVAWDDRMEDLATFEISRAQTWQWLHHAVALDDGTAVTPELVRRIFDEELGKIVDEARGFFAEQGEDVVREQARRFREARDVAERIFTEEAFRPFLTCRSDRVGDEAQQRALLRGDSCRE